MTDTDTKDLETVIRYIQQDLNNTKLRVDAMLACLHEDKRRFTLLMNNITKLMESVRADIFQHITGKKLTFARDQVDLTNDQYMSVVEALKDVGVDVSGESTMKLNQYKITNKAWRTIK